MTYTLQLNIHHTHRYLLQIYSWSAYESFIKHAPNLVAVVVIYWFASFVGGKRGDLSLRTLIIVRHTRSHPTELGMMNEIVDSFQ